MMNGSHIDDWALNAYVDGQISAGQKAEIEAQLARDPAMAARVASWRRQRDLLKAEYDGVLAEPMPPEIKATLNGGSGRRWRPALAAAAALLFILGGLGGWFLKGQSGPDLAAGLGQQALAAHMVFSSEKRHPVEVLAHEKDHLAMWLGKRLGTPFKVPDLTAEGYTFLGGRLLAEERGPAGLLMYEDATGQRVSILLEGFPADGESSIRVDEKGTLIACSWREGRLGFAVAGEMAREPMMKLAQAIYEKVES